MMKKMSPNGTTTVDAQAHVHVHAHADGQTWLVESVEAGFRIP